MTKRLRLRAARHGIAVRFTAPRDAAVVRVRLLRLRGGRASGRPLASTVVALQRAGRQTLVLRARHVTRGLYAVEVAPGLSAHALGRATTVRMRIVR